MTRRPRTALLLALAGGFVLLGWTPSGRTGQPQQPDPAQGPPSSPPPHTLDRAGSVIEIARDLARVRVRCDTLSRQFDAARRAFGRANYQRTVERVEQLLRTYNGPSCPDNEPDDSHATDGGSSPARSLRSPTAFASPEATVDHTSDSSTSVADRARLLAARALLKRDDGERALAFAERVEPTSTPAPWSVQWLRARALQTSDRPDRAAKAYRAVVRSGPPAPTHRARARRAHSLLDAGRWRSAVRAIDSLLSRFPQYPRRFELMFGRGRALEAMGDFRRAARAYQRTWLRFPHKPEGDRALARLDTLRLQGVDVPEVEPAGRFEHYRRLRVHKHWDLAHELLTSLERDLDDAREPTELRHRIWMQLAMNAYVPKRDRKALEYFSKLQRAYRQGRRAGIDIDRVRRYRSKALARLGELDGARRALAARYEGYSEYYRDLQLAEFFRDHGEYERAFELLDPNFPEWRKRRWSYTWLLYKTGRHERALENFGRLARYRDGREEARAMYWRARTMGKSGRRDEAKTLYRKLVAEHPLSYYGIQARNRLLDMRRRASVGGLFASRTRSVLDSSRRVLAELDRAARDPQRTPARRMVAPRTRQKRPATQPGSNACDGIGERTRFCHLMSGRVPPGTRRLVSRILSPLRSPYGIAIGAVRGLAIPKGRQTPKESTTSATAGSGDGETDLDAPADAVDSRWRTDARIHWPPDRDPNGGVEVVPASTRGNRADGPVPNSSTGYLTPPSDNALHRAARRAGDLFPALTRANWLWNIGLEDAAREAVRRVAREFRAVVRRGAPPEGEPHELPQRRWTYLIDHRDRRGVWGYTGPEEKLYPIPDNEEARKRLADRQRSIVERATDLRPLLVDALQRVGDYHLVRRITLDRTGGGWNDSVPTDRTADRWSRAYPRAFPDRVLDEVGDHPVNPYLVWSLMAAESAFNPDTVSRANAFGLLQVIPRTAIKVADWVGAEDFGPHQLVEEETAIRFGVRYFRSLVRKFRGQELLAVIGYNAGPHRVADWLDQRGDQPFDEFVEEVPFAQARDYVKKVLKFTGIYMRVYEGARTMYVGQRLNTNPRPMPNF